MLFLMIVVVVLVFFGIAFVLIYIDKDANKEAKSQIENWMERNHFTKTSEIIMYPDGSPLGCNVYLDELDKKMFIVNLMEKTKYLIPFEEIIGMEIMEDGISTNGVGRAIVGGILFGGVGAIVGSNTGKKTINSLSIVIYLNKISDPMIEIVITSSNTSNIKTDGIIYKNQINFARKMDATIRAIIANNEKH